MNVLNIKTKTFYLAFLLAMLFQIPIKGQDSLQMVKYMELSRSKQYASTLPRSYETNTQVKVIFNYYGELYQTEGRINAFTDSALIIYNRFYNSLDTVPINIITKLYVQNFKNGIPYLFLGTIMCVGGTMLVISFINNTQRVLSFIGGIYSFSFGIMADILASFRTITQKQFDISKGWTIKIKEYQGKPKARWHRV